MKKIINKIPLLYLIIATFWLRLINIGYSNYQGDEIKALYRPQVGQSMLDFLLTQRKGPIQFLVTYLMSFINPDYDNEFLLRLPFTVASIFAIYFFYKFVQIEFGQKIALYSTLFISLNGLFVAFARIVQYQSFVILFSVLALYLFSLSTKYNDWKIYGLYLGMLLWGLSILAHYDGIFIAPFVFYLVYRWYVNSRNNKQTIKHLIYATTIFLASLSIFYIPFFLSISESTKEYWAERISKQSVSSTKTFMTYNPLFLIYIYAILGLIGIFRIKENFSVVIWFLFPLISLETLVGNPGTHIYTYVIPFCIIMAFGLEEFHSFLKKRFFNPSKYISIFILSTIYISSFLFSHLLFIENKQEYPWENKNFLFLNFKKQSRQSLFGFPYYRHWEKVESYLASTKRNGYFITNEKKSITRYYIPGNFKNLELYPYDSNSTGEIYVIYIKNPQSGNKKILDKEQSYWEERYQPVKTFSNHGRIVTTIYRFSGSEWEKVTKGQ
ncbi:glycosyltransferase family 39 protein [Chlorogloeopsis sp. ULAP01]|uniref:ArnT family glycosyltransferase n=1 Tax=Chlorogloeopsis sp. ULAP01 TaxID=3056483 RepID=UPI0025AAB0CE|nr:glycosyltransferase family 39 protein [Chlorogloeopsis sp. ULAP01]MDM9382705.1 glycosyltransferase family 39 protein [Chlorogloeopsis sp. ULAP01]